MKIKREMPMRMLVALVTLMLGTAAAFAQGYPNKPVRIVVGFAAGGPTDVIARIVAQKLSETLGQQFYVENIGGAGSNTASGQVARATPDGYTIMAISTGFMVNMSLYAKLPYDAVKDFAPVTLICYSPNVVSVHPSVPAKTVPELRDLIKANPGRYSFAGPGTGSTPHLSGELFRLTYDLDLPHVPFTGAGPAIQSTLGGHTPVVFSALPPAVPAAKDGKLRVLGVAADKRVAALPDVPTFAEQGITGQDSDTLTGLVAPAGTPKDIVDLLQREIAKIVAQPDVKEKLDTLGFIAVANKPEEFGARIKSEMEKWGKVVRDAKLRVE
jgi:tripartite-type tricarboxylate transporter receptor subunit TctC